MKNDIEKHLFGADLIHNINVLCANLHSIQEAKRIMDILGDSLNVDNLEKINEVYQALKNIPKVVKDAVKEEMDTYIPALEKMLEDNLLEINEAIILGKETLSSYEKELEGSLDEHYNVVLNNLIDEQKVLIEQMQDLKNSYEVSVASFITLVEMSKTEINNQKETTLTSIREAENDFIIKSNIAISRLNVIQENVVRIELKVEALYKSMAVMANLPFFNSIDEGANSSKVSVGDIFGVIKDSEDKLSLYELIEKASTIEEEEKPYVVKLRIDNIFSSFQFNKLENALGDSLYLEGSKYLNVLNAFSEFLDKPDLLLLAQENLGILSLELLLSEYITSYSAYSFTALAPLPFFGSTGGNVILDSEGYVIGGGKYNATLKREVVLFNFAPLPYFNANEGSSILDINGNLIGGTYAFKKVSINYRFAPIPLFNSKLDLDTKIDLEGNVLYFDGCLSLIKGSSSEGNTSVVNTVSDVTYSVTDSRTYTSLSTLRGINNVTTRSNMLTSPKGLNDKSSFVGVDRKYLFDESVDLNTNIRDLNNRNAAFPYSNDVVHIFVTNGQSNSIGAQGLPLVDKYLNNPYPKNSLMLSSRNPQHDVRPIIMSSGVNTVIPFDPKDIIGLKPLVTHQQGTSTRGGSISEGFGFQFNFYMEKNFGYVPNTLWINVGWGGVSIGSLKDPSGLLFNNYKNILKSACEEIIKLGKIPVVTMIQWNQGEGDTGNSNYAEDLEEIRVMMEDYAKTLTGQKSYIPLIATQPSSFVSTLSQSCMQIADAQELYKGRIYNSGGNYMCEFAKDLLHLTGYGHGIKGEIDFLTYLFNEMYTEKKELLKVSNIKYTEGNSEITVEFSDNIVIDPVLEPLYDLGITVVDSGSINEIIKVTSYIVLNKRTIRLFLSRAPKNTSYRAIRFGYNSKYSGKRDDINNIARTDIRMENTNIESFLTGESIKFYLPHTIERF